VPATNRKGDVQWVCGLGHPTGDFKPVLENYREYTTIEPKYLPSACRS
jgi:hypothetical protein